MLQALQAVFLRDADFVQVPTEVVFAQFVSCPSDYFIHRGRFHSGQLSDIAADGQTKGHIFRQIAGVESVVNQVWIRLGNRSLDASVGPIGEER